MNERMNERMVDGQIKRAIKQVQNKLRCNEERLPKTARPSRVELALRQTDEAQISLRMNLCSRALIP